MKLKKMSLKIQLILWSILCILPVLIIAVAGNAYMIYQNYEKEMDGQYDLLEYGVQNMEKKLEEIRAYELTLLTNSDDMELMCSSEDHNTQVLAKRRLFLDVTYTMMRNPDIQTMYICAMDNDQDLVINFGATDLGYNDSLRAICQATAANPAVKGWSTVSLMDKYYFFNIEYTRSGYVCALVSMEKLFQDYAGLFERFALIDMSMETAVAGDMLYIGRSPEDIERESKGYQIITYPSLSVGYQLISLISRGTVFTLTNGFQKFLLFLTILDICLIPILIFVLNKKYIKPLEMLVSVMNQVKMENWDVALDEENVLMEFRQVNSTFNSMIREVKQLRIDVYEEILERKNLEIAQLQTQAKPHFYLNSLNVIYSMVQCDEKKMVLKLIRHLADYCRYSMNTDNYLVQVQEELDFITSYVEIQKLRYHDQIDFTVTCEDELKSVSIPTMLLQEFVYNSFKYAFDMVRDFVIAIQIFKEDEWMRIIITDNGPGYPLEVLDQFKMDRPVMKGHGKHIGIHNTVRRINFFYNGKAEIHFSNLPEGGAGVDMRLPLEF